MSNFYKNRVTWNGSSNLILDIYVDEVLITGTVSADIYLPPLNTRIGGSYSATASFIREGIDFIYPTQFTNRQVDIFVSSSDTSVSIDNNNGLSLLSYEPVGNFRVNRKGFNWLINSKDSPQSDLAINEIVKVDSDRILGRFSPGVGVVQQVQLSGGLTFSGGVLSSQVFTHPTYTARSITATGAQVLSTFTSDTIGSVTGITTRTLTPANIGAAATGHTHSVSDITDSTTTGKNLVTLPNPGSITFLRVNANNTVSALAADTFRTAIGAQIAGSYLTDNQTITLSGDLSGSGTTSISATISNNAVTTAKIIDNAVTNAKLADMTANTIKGRSGTNGDPQDLTATQVRTILGAGSANGLATLDSSGLVPSSQLPSYVDDVLEFTNLAGFPATGETGKIYVAQDTNKIYRWSGSAYIEISPTAGNSDTATKLATARNISASGDATWTVSFDGSADVSSALTIGNDKITTAKILNSNVTYAKIQSVTSKRLLGRSATSNGVVGEISIGSNLTLSDAGVLTATNTVYSHPTGFTNQPATALVNAAVISQISVNDEGHVTGVTTRNLTAANVGAAATGHTHSISDVTGLQSALNDKDNYIQWNISDGVSTDSIDSNETLTFRGSGATTVQYDTPTKILTILSTDTDTTYSGSTSIFLSGNSFQRAGLTGDVVSATNSNATTISSNVVTNDKLADMTANTIKGRSGTNGDPQDLTAAQVRTILNVADGAQVNVATNLTYTTGATSGVVNSSTGTNATIPAATTSLAGLMTNADKTKLDGIAAGAQVNVGTNLGTAIVSTNSRSITSSTGNDITVPVATTVVAGFMSHTDKTKLDGIAAGAQVNVGTNIAQGTRTATTVPITSSTGTGATLDVASTTLAGVMSSADKTKLDGIAAGAQVNVATNLTYTTGATSGVVNSSTGTNATIPAVTTSLAGLMTNVDKTKLDGIAASANNYSLPEATSTVRGGIELFSDTDQSVAANAVTTTTGRTYGIQLNSDGQAVVNVPWVDTDTVYTHPTQTAIDVNATDNGINVIDRVVVNTLGHVTSVTTRDLSNATTSAAGVMSSTDKTKLDGIAASANNYSFRVADGTPTSQFSVFNNETLSFKAGANVDISFASLIGGEKQIIFSSTDTVYTHPTGGANTTITNASGLVLSSITVNTFGHVTAVGSKTLAAADIPNLDTSKITTGTLPVGRGGTGATTLTSGNILVGNGTSAISAPYTVETTLTGGSSAIPRADAVKAYVDSLLASNDAMIFKGTLGTGGTYTSLPTTHGVGWTIKVITAGTYAGKVAEIGDMYVSLVTRSGSGNTNADWAVIQTNIDGAVVGPASAVSGRIATFNGTTGKLIQDSGFTIATSVPSGAVFTDTVTRLRGTTGGTLVSGDITLASGGATTVSQSGNTITISSTNTVYSHPTGFTNQPATALVNAAVISQISVNDEGHVTGVTTRNLTAANVGAAPSSHTHGNITNVGAIGSTADLVVVTGTSGVLTTQSRSGIDSRTSFPPSTHTHAISDVTGLQSALDGKDNYVRWNISDGNTGSGSIASNENLTVRGSGATIVSYDPSIKQLTISSTDTNTDTVTRLRGTTGGTFVSGDITIASGGATTVSQSGNTITISSTDTNTTYSQATSAVLGLVKLGSDTVQSTAANAVTTTASRTYAVQLNATGQMLVNVPWVDTNTTYTAGTGLSLSGTQFVNTDLGSSQVIFKNIANDAGTVQFTASSNNDKVLFRGSGSTSITFDPGNNMVIISSTDTNTTYTAGTGLSLSGTVFSANFGTTSGTIAQGNDSRFHNAVTIGTANGLSLSVQALSLALSTTSAAGAMSASDKTKLDGIATGANNYSLPEATSTVRGGIELFSDTDQSVAANAVTTTTGRTYGIQLNSDGQAVVNVPWVDTNTTYTAGSGLTLTGTVFSNASPNATHTGEVTGSVALTITDDAVTNLKLANMTANTIKGRISTDGDPQDLTATQVRTILNVADGANNYSHPTGGANTTITNASGLVLSSITVNTLGHVTAVGSKTLAAADIPNLDASKITSGIIDAARLPSYVDDVLEFTNLASFPATGETGKLYVALDTNKVYRWSGTVYIFITSGAVDSVAGKTGVVLLVKGDVGLGNVDNTSDAAKPVSTAQQNALNLKANLASPALTGTPTAPTAATDINTTQIATTAYVKAQGYVTSSGVTSVAATAGVGITITGSPITTSGTLTITNSAPNATHTGEVTGSVALTITNDAVTNAKLANMGVSTIKGRATAGTGDPEDLTAAQVRTILNVADGAQVNVATNLSIGSNTSTVVRVDSSTGTNATIPLATGSLAGILSATTQTIGGEKTFTNKLTVSGSTAGQVVLDIQGTSGQLFSITDSLVGLLFSVNDISGIPVFETYSDGTVNIGTFGSPEVVVTTGAVALSGTATAPTPATDANNTQIATTAYVKAQGYVTTAGARAALSFVAGSGAYNSSTGVITIPTNTNQLTNGAGYVTSSGVTSVAATAGVGITITGSPITTSGTLTITNSAPNATHTGEVTGSVALTITNDAVTNAKLANMGVSTIKGRATAGTGDPEDLTAAQVRTILNVADGANNYTHPTQTAIDANATDNGVNVIDRVVVKTLGHVTSVTTRDLSNATTSAAGVMSAADKTKLDGIATNANNYSLPEATSTVRGGIELFSDTDQSVAANAVTATTGRTYGIQLNSDGQAVVNVPWVDTNTTYSVGNGGLTEINFTSALNTKLAGIAVGADNYGSWSVANGSGAGQFSVGSGSKVLFKEGANVTIGFDPANNIISIAATDTNTTYTAGSGLTLTGTVFSNASPNATHTGDVTGSGALTIASNVVTNAKLADMAVNTIKGRATAGTGDPEDLTATQVRTILNVADGANNYSHPTGFSNQPATALANAVVISQITVNTNGHVTGVTTRSLTAANIGAAATSHNHDASNITSGTLPVGRGGTGATTFTGNEVLLGNGTSAIKSTSNLSWKDERALAINGFGGQAELEVWNGGGINTGVSIWAQEDIVAFSDKSVKTNIRGIDNVIERIQNSRGVIYDRTDTDSKDNIGFIAQELEVNFPELVFTNESTGLKSVKYQNAVAVLFEAIKEQQKQINELKDIINLK